MFFNHQIIKSTGSYWEQIKKLQNEIATADAIILGAGAGLSTSAGFTYSGGFYPYQTLTEYWAYWSRHIYINRYMEAPNPVHKKLLDLLKGKDYFVLTTNVDHLFQKAGLINIGYSTHREITVCGNVWTVVRA